MIGVMGRRERRSRSKLVRCRVVVRGCDERFWGMECMGVFWD